MAGEKKQLDDPAYKEQLPTQSRWEDFLRAMGILLFCFVDFLALLYFSDTAYGVQICTLIGYSCFVAMYTFLRSNLGPGYSLLDRDDPPLMLRVLSIHGVFCGGIFAVQTFAMRRWRTFPASWIAESGPKHDSPASLVLIVACVVAMMTEILILRRILRRSGEDAQSPGSV